MDNSKICSIGDEIQREAAGCNSGEVNVGEMVLNIINIVIAILGVVAVIFVIVGAVQFMTSQGDPAKVKKGRDTILYAILGLLLATLAYAIVNFVLANVLNG